MMTSPMLSNGAVRLETFHDDPDDYIHAGRSQLPSTTASREQISLWSVLKQSIGKDLSRLTVPVVFNEPLSFLQRLAEYMEYCDLIRLASEQDDPVKRLEYVTAFAVSTLASNRDRLSKPFNPLLHETYELDRSDDLGFRIVCEQVSHHPPISAFHADGPSFRFYGSIYPKLKFWGRSIDCQPKGVLTLELTKRNEIYTWTPINCSIHNLVMGKMYIDLHGTMDVICHSNDLSVKVHFKSSNSWLGKEANHIEGYIVDKSKKKLRALYGEWTEFLASCSAETFETNFTAWDKEHKEHKEKKQTAIGSGGHSPPPARRFSTTDMLSSPDTPEDNGMPLVHCKSTKLSSGKKKCDKSCSKITHLSVLPLLTGSTVLWRARPRPPLSEQFYHFTLFAMTLNELDTTKRALLPPTDSRLRPDIRLMEDGNIDSAAGEKHRLEEKQRDVRNALKKTKHDAHGIPPGWFSHGPHPFVKDHDAWHFNGCYWNRDWSQCEQVF